MSEGVPRSQPVEKSFDTVLASSYVRPLFVKLIGKVQNGEILNISEVGGILLSLSQLVDNYPDKITGSDRELFEVILEDIAKDQDVLMINAEEEGRAVNATRHRTAIGRAQEILRKMKLRNVGHADVPLPRPSFQNTETPTVFSETEAPVVSPNDLVSATVPDELATPSDERGTASSPQDPLIEPENQDSTSSFVTGQRIFDIVGKIMNTKGEAFEIGNIDSETLNLYGDILQAKEKHDLDLEKELLKKLETKWREIAVKLLKTGSEAEVVEGDPKNPVERDLLLDLENVQNKPPVQTGALVTSAERNQIPVPVEKEAEKVETILNPEILDRVDPAARQAEEVDEKKRELFEAVFNLIETKLENITNEQVGSLSYIFKNLDQNTSQKVKADAVFMETLKRFEHMLEAAVSQNFPADKYPLKARLRALYDEVFVFVHETNNTNVFEAVTRVIDEARKLTSPGPSHVNLASIDLQTPSSGEIVPAPALASVPEKNPLEEEGAKIVSAFIQGVGSLESAKKLLDFIATDEGPLVLQKTLADQSIQTSVADRVHLLMRESLAMDDVEKSSAHNVEMSESRRIWQGVVYDLVAKLRPLLPENLVMSEASMKAEHELAKHVVPVHDVLAVPEEHDSVQVNNVSPEVIPKKTWLNKVLRAGKYATTVLHKNLKETKNEGKQLVSDVKNLFTTKEGGVALEESGSKVKRSSFIANRLINPLKKIFEKGDKKAADMVSDAKVSAEESYNKVVTNVKDAKTFILEQLESMRGVLAANFKQDKSVSSPPNLRSPEAEKAVQNILKNNFNKVLASYEKLTPVQKMSLSATLFAAGFAGAAISSVPAIVGIGAGKIVLRAVSAAAAAKATETFIKNSERSERTKENAKKIGLAVGVSVFLLGSLGDIKDMAQWIGDHLPSFGGEGVLPSPDVPAPAASVPLPADAASIPGGMTAAPMPDVSAAPLPESAWADVPVFEPVTTSLDIMSGDTFSGILSQNDVLQTLFGEGALSLSDSVKNSLVANLINSLSPEELAAVGVKAGDEHLIFAGDTLNIQKLAELAGKKTLSLADGSSLSLLGWAERAQKLLG